MNKSSVGTGDNVTTHESEGLSRFRRNGQMMYRSLDAAFCTVCERVYGVKCPICGMDSGDHVAATVSETPTFTVARPLETRFREGQVWTKTTCRKCDFSFQVRVVSGYEN